MNIKSIRSHLVGFSILRKRKTTVAHAFASALAPVDAYNSERIIRALQLLGQSENDIRCIYCNAPADTWDHLIGLVSKGRFSGFGHVLGNLVPCCKSCNSAKGGKDWKVFLGGKVSGDESLALRIAQIKDYQATYGAPGVSYEAIAVAAPDLLAEFENLQIQILEMMERADLIADQIREKLQAP